MKDLASYKIDGRSTDLRRNGVVSVSARKHNKYRESFHVWESEFPNQLRPKYTAYMLLELRGWKFSSIHGWRKNSVPTR